MTWNELPGKKSTFKAVTVIAMCTLLLLLIETNIFGTKTKIMEMVTTHGEYIFQRNPVQKTNSKMKRSGVGNGRLLTTKHLKNINIDNEKQCSRHRFLVYKCDVSSMCGGLGDREKGIVSSFLLALLTNRTFVLNMTQPCELQQYLQPNVYNWYKCSTFLSNVRKEDIAEFNYVVGSRKFLKQIQDFDFDSNWTKPVIVLRFNAYIIDRIRLHKLAEARVSWLLKTTNEETIHLVLHTLFKPSKRIIKDFAKFHMNHIREKHSVCCHIRKGKNPSIPTDNKLPRGTPNETVIFDFLRRYDDSKKNIIYIATDSDDVRKQAEAMFDTHVNINRTIVHIDRLGKLKHSRTEACEGFYTVLFEQYILSQCDTLVLTRSNFGGIAAYIRGASDNLFLYHQKTNIVLKSNFTDMQNVFKFI